MKTIIVSGTPCTGKTTIAKKLAKLLGYKYIDVKKIIKDNKLEDSYDKERKCKVIDTKKLNKYLIKVIKQAKKNKESLFIDSHLAHHLDPKQVDKCIITKCNLKTLKSRLKRRKYSKDKIRENLDCEIFDICYNEAKDNGHDILIIETDKGADYVKRVLVGL